MTSLIKPCTMQLFIYHYVHQTIFFYKYSLVRAPPITHKDMAKTKQTFVFAGSVLLVTCFLVFLIQRENRYKIDLPADFSRGRHRTGFLTPSLLASHYGKWNSSCWLPPSGYKAWGAGVVTTLLPKVERNCTKLIAKDEKEIKAVNASLRLWKNPASDRSLLPSMGNCTWLREYFTENLYVTKLEKSFPIAYNFLIHNNAQQVLRLLRGHTMPTAFIQTKNLVPSSFQ